jgi:hypothetical protein
VCEPLELLQVARIDAAEISVLETLDVFDVPQNLDLLCKFPD